jgi:hypothetical protein
MNKKSMLISRILAKSFLATFILVVLIDGQAKSSLKSHSQVPEIISEKSLTNQGYFILIRRGQNPLK